jgi:hypothetical protein
LGSRLLNVVKTKEKRKYKITHSALPPRNYPHPHPYRAIDAPPIAYEVVPWFGSLVFMMGWLELRVLGRMTRPEVEGWLLADIV